MITIKLDTALEKYDIETRNTILANLVNNVDLLHKQHSGSDLKDLLDRLQLAAPSVDWAEILEAYWLDAILESKVKRAADADE
jgi:hypothetical protein